MKIGTLAARIGAVLMAALALPDVAHAGIAYPTNVAGTFADAAVNLQCDVNGVNCAPVTPANPVPVAVNGIVTTANFTTPSGTTQYSVGQLIANSATAGSVTPLALTVCRVNGGTFQIDRVRVHTPDTGAAGQTVKVEFYQTSPTFTNGDHGAWLTTESGFLGEALVTLSYTFSDQSKGIGVPLGGIIKGSCAASSTTIFAAIQAGTAITPQGAKVWTATVEATAN